VHRAVKTTGDRESDGDWCRFRDTCRA